MVCDGQDRDHCVGKVIECPPDQDCNIYCRTYPFVFTTTASVQTASASASALASTTKASTTTHPPTPAPTPPPTTRAPTLLPTIQPTPAAKSAEGGGGRGPNGSPPH